jgi:hypothetical protein
MTVENTDRASFWRPYVHALGAALLLMLVSIWNGYPLLYEDTEAYVGRPATALSLKGPSWLASEWASPEQTSPTGGAPTASSPSAGGEETNDGWLAGRSVYWGTLAYLVIVGFGVWGIVALNALSTGLVIAFFWFRALRQSTFRFYLVVAVVAACSYASLFVALLMPDILAALLIAGMALLIVTWRELRVADRLVLLLLCVLAAISHDSIMLIAVGIVGVALLNRAFSGAAGWLKSWGQAAAISAPIVAGVLALLLFNLMAVAQTGQAPMRYPFLSAHLTSLESGQRHLEKKCPEAGYALCSYQDRLPAVWTDFIFSRSEETGIFGPAPPDRRRELSDEQYRFAINVAADQPALLTFELVRETIVQLLTFDLYDLRQSAKQGFFERNFPTSVVAQAERSKLWTDPGTFKPFEYLQTITAVLGLAAIIIFGVLRAMGLVSAPKHFWSIMLLILAGVIVNAAVCGILASPWGRFQARVVWLITLLGVTVLAIARTPVKSATLNKHGERAYAVGSS